MYVQLHEDGTYWRQIKEGRNFEFSGRCLQPPETLTPEEVVLYQVFPLVRVTRPVFDPLTHNTIELEPAPIEGVWTQQWAIQELDVAVAAENLQRAEVQRISALWQAAHDYEFAQVSGSAIGLLAMGVMQGKPKCFAVQMWIKSIWTLYYTRKAMGDSSTDFTSCGACPHSVPELMEELGV